MSSVHSIGQKFFGVLEQWPFNPESFTKNAKIVFLGGGGRKGVFGCSSVRCKCRGIQAGLVAFNKHHTLEILRRVDFLRIL